MQGAMTSVFLLLSFGCASALHLRTRGESAKLKEAKKPVEMNVLAAEKSLGESAAEWKKAKEPVFYMTAMGKLASKHQTRLWLHSLRDVGKYDGEVVMITDDAVCLAKNLQGLLGKWMEDKSNEAMDVYDGGENRGPVYMVKVAKTTNIKEMKQQKAKAWQNIRTAGLKPQFIVHTDQDIVFGTELKAFLQNVNVLEVTDATPLMALFTDQGVTKGQMHTGIVVMFPGNKTETCLNDWGDKILKTHASKYHGLLDQSQEETLEWKTKGKKEVDSVTTHGAFDGSMEEEAGVKIEQEFSGPDQRALASTSSCKAPKLATSGGIVTMPAQYLLMPTSGSLGKGARAAFIHFTNTNRWKSIKQPTMSKYFTNVLGLDKTMDFFDYEKC